MNEEQIFKLNGRQPGQIKKLLKLEDNEVPFYMELPDKLGQDTVIYDVDGKKLGILDGKQSFSL